MVRSAAKILFVDDEADAVEPIMELVREQGFKTVYEKDLSGAMDVIRKQSSSLLLVWCDLCIKEENGLDLRRKMNPDYQDVPFVLYSGFITQSTLLDAIDLKVTKFIEKPIDFNDIAAVIQQVASARLEFLQEKAILKNIFIEEVEELVENLESEILELESDPSDSECLNRIFRIVHTIKGGSGVLDWPEFTKAVHSYEDILTVAKENTAYINPNFFSVLLQGYDFVTMIMEKISRDDFEFIDLSHWQSLFANFKPEAAENSKSSSSPANPVKKQKSNQKADKDRESIKVPTHTLDEFMELSGEITVIRNTVKKLVANIQKEVVGNNDVKSLADFLDEMNKINSSMQQKITDLRKIPISEVTHGFPRMIRDLSIQLEKSISLSIEGDSLRIDTKLAHILSNCLVHIVRNSADHGIEKPSARQEKGKTEGGTIHISCNERNDLIEIEISDDGAGIDASFIGKKAVEKKLISASELDRLAPNKVLELIFAPGFSTASQITDVSGRGVGMDMVKTSIENIGGTVEITSTVGQGSCFILKLPVPKSVLIIESLRVVAGDKIFQIPQDSIQRLIRFETQQKNDYIQCVEGKPIFKLDGQLIELIHIREIFEEDFRPDYSQISESFIILKNDGLSFALAVDDIVDAEEIVVKKLGSHVPAKYILGATFLEENEVGLILDIEQIAQKFKIENHKRLQEETDNESNIDTLEVLNFSLNLEGHFCFPLDAVFRLEEIKSKDIQMVSRQRTVIYRNQSIPLVDVAGKIQDDAKASVWEQEFLPTVVICHEEHFYGLVVDAINDIRSIPSTFENTNCDIDSQIGCLISGDQIWTVLDPLKVAGIEKLEVTNKDEIETLDVTKEVEPIEEEAGGWGLF